MSTHHQHLLYAIKSNIGFIKLNRPDALNALAPTMMASLRQRLLQWRDLADVHMVVVTSSSDKAFCAGGDLKAVHKYASTQQFDMLENLFREEYSLTHLIRTFPKPFVSFVNGIVMGGGLGLCVHGSHRVFGEDVIAAMPETNIGFFPDVGATTFLTQSPGKIGLYLGLTGRQINAGDALYAGWGTHYIPQAAHGAVIDGLKALNRKTQEHIDNILGDYAKAFPASTLENRATEIQALFSADTLAGIFETIQKDGGVFAIEILNDLSKRSPTSLAVTFEQLKRGVVLTDFADVMSMEYDLSQNFVRGHDFVEGIRAAVVDKDRSPNWHPSLLGGVNMTHVADHFKAASPGLFSKSQAAALKLRA